MNNPTKDNPILRYYEAEMRYLREASKEFARDFPEGARRLNLDRPGEPDPNIERLFESFAFLMARLRLKLDDAFPEITEGLLNMLSPCYLRMIPSLSILEVIPTDSGEEGQRRLEPGLEVMSAPVGDEAVECIYRTTQAVDLHPLRLTEAQVYAREDGRSVLRFRLELHTQGNAGPPVSAASALVSERRPASGAHVICSAHGQATGRSSPCAWLPDRPPWRATSHAGSAYRAGRVRD